MHRTLTRGLFSATLVAMLAVPLAAPAQVADLSGELDGFEQQIDALEAKYLKPVDVSASKYRLDARYNDGRVAYHTGQYQRAASLLYSAVADPEFNSFGSRREGVYMLGESLYRVRNFLGAAEQFEKILNEGSGEYYSESAARLLEIAYQMRDFDKLDALHSRLSGSAMSGKIAYLSGKAFYEQGNHERARASFVQAAQTPEYRMTAEYFRGVTFVAEKNLGDAKRIFTALVNTAGLQSPQDLEVVDLAWLALGRIAYDEEDIERAVDNYSRLERSSPHFDRSLWEQTWVLVSRGNYAEARRNVDIITYLDDPDPDILAQSQLLRADLSLKLGEYDTARADYHAVLDRFSPIKQQMDQFAETHQDMDAFFTALVASDRGQNVGMPPLIETWIRNDREMRAATKSLRAMREAEMSIADSYRMFTDLGSRLNSGTRVQAFPGLADGFMKGVEIEERLIEIRQELVDAQHSSVKDSMSKSQKEAWSTLVSELEELRKRTAEIPKGRDALAKRQREVTAEFDRLRRRVDETGLEIEGQTSQLQAVENYLAQDSARPISKTAREEAERAREELRTNLATLQTEHDRLRAEVDLLRQGVGEGDAVRQAETKLRKDYQAKLGEAERFLDALGGADAQAARAKLAEIQRQLNEYFNSLDALAGQAVGGLDGNVASQRKLADQHRESLQLLITSSQSGAGVIAYVNFMKARAEFTEIVLRGEVGVIDVVWQKKEDISGKISKLFEDRTSELNLLQEAFEEVR